MANLITVGRLVLLFVTVALILTRPAQLAPWTMVLLIIVFAGDGIDGWVARKRNSTSQFGAVFDIAGDRIVETVLWVVFSNLNLVPIWVPIAVITRGSIVDAIRSMSYAEGMTAFGERNMMRSPITQWLTAGRFMRGLYGYAKAAGFVFLAGLAGYVAAEPMWPPLTALYDLTIARLLGWTMVWLAFGLMLVRGLPVLIDAWPWLLQPQSSLGAPGAAPVVAPPDRDANRT